MASDDDDAVRRAIQVSLEEAEAVAQRGGRAQVVDLTGDDDDDDGVWDGFDNVDEMDYWKAIVLSLGLGTHRHRPLSANNADPSYGNCLQEKIKSEIAEHDGRAAREPSPESSESVKPAAILSDTESEEDNETTSGEEETQPGNSTQKAALQPGLPANTGLSSLNRAQMERDRLARLKRGGTLNEHEGPSKRPRADNMDDPPPIASSSNTPGDSKLQYPDGMIKWTYASGYPKESHHITIEEVLQKDTLKAAVLSGFQVSPFRFHGLI